MRKRDELTDPGSCMSRAKDEEWTFVLLGRDVAAPSAVRVWIGERIRLGKNQPGDPQIVEAEQWISTVVDEQRQNHRPQSGVELIAAERQRQISVEGWTADHDDTHRSAEMADAAAVYVDAAGAIARGASPSELHTPASETEPGETGHSSYTGFDASPSWPWDEEWLKLSPDPIRNLVKAGALIAAEIDRLQRISPYRDPDARAADDAKQGTLNFGRDSA